MSPVGIVIVGAGEAGTRAASALREGGYAGPVTLVGEEPHGPYERPPLSKAALAEDAPAAPPALLDAARLAALGLRHIAGVRATGLDRGARRLLLEDGRALPYAKLLIAAGARARPLAVPGAERAGVLTLRTFSDALRLRGRLRPGARLAVVGGGFVGLEVAAGAVARGCAVTLVEAGPRLLARGVPGTVAARVAERHRAAGVDLRVGVGVAEIRPRGEGARLCLADGVEVDADAVVAGVGAVPETALAAAAGLAVDDGVRVDGCLRTEDPDVFAAGDCCSFPHPLYGGRRLRLEAWRNAQDGGAHAARAMLGSREPYAAVPWFWSDQYGETLQVAGLGGDAAETVERDLGAGRLFFQLDAEERLVAAGGYGPNGIIAREVKLAEMLIARRARPDPAALASPGTRLKALLAA